MLCVKGGSDKRKRVRGRRRKERGMITIVLSNQKGGVAKSTTAATLANGLFNRGKRVLMIDEDPQSNLSYMSGVNLLKVQNTLYDVFSGEITLQDAIQPLKIGLDIVTGGLQLTAADSQFTQTGREYMLREALEAVQDSYDYCVIDTSPNLGILTTNALTAADYIVIPMTADALALQGMMQLNGFITNVRKYCNQNLQIAGILLTMYNDRARLSRALEDQINATAEAMGTKVFNARIRRTQAVSDAIAVQADIYEQAPNATATEDYSAFTDEFIQTIGE